MPAARSFALLLRGLLLAAIAAGPASAHEQTYPVAADTLLIRTDAGPGTQVFQFEAAGGEVPLLDHDPREDGSSVLVRGTGANADRTALATLDRNLWSATPAGFVYDDPSGARGGIRRVVLESGLITIEGGGPQWSLAPAGPLDAVWVHFRLGDTAFCSQAPSAAAAVNQAGRFEAYGASAPAACPEQVCGDGIPQPPEQCDDGNLASGDGCEVSCETGPCEGASEESTFAAIQSVVFESAYGCTDGACHDVAFPKNDLALTRALAYDELLGAAGTGQPSQDYPFLKLVEPGEPDLSYLFIKLAAKTYPGQEFAVEPGTPMPSGGKVALSEEHLEALRLWIRGGAPRDDIVSGTQELLGTCLPPPTPLKIPVPDPPAAGTGIQLRQTAWPLPPTAPETQGEDEICMATYYDLSGLVPESAKVDCPPQFQQRRFCSNDAAQVCAADTDCGAGNACLTQNVNNPGGECFRYHRQVLYQDPQSHHSIIHIYTGTGAVDDPAWGEWTIKRNDADDLANGTPCDPTAVDPLLGYNPDCSGEVVSSLACIGYGPDDASNFGNIAGGGGGNLPQFSGSQEPYYEQEFADGVYATLPLKGVVVWNSHAFNLTATPSTMAQYLNLEYAALDDQRHPLQGIFDARYIFAQDVPPFETREICATYTIPRHARLFELGSHTHVRGVRWRTWAPPNTPCQPGCPPGGCLFGFCRCEEDPLLPKCSELGYPRDDAPLYFSTDYSDPLQLEFDPPVAYDSASEEDRTFLFCSLYDNGSTPESPPVKRQSTSPDPPAVFGLSPALLEVIGGPCPDSELRCLDGPQRGEVCDPASEVADCGGEGLCDACPVHGGVTTEDEMFILLGSYFLPEPGATALGLAAAAALAGLARRRRTAG